MQGFQVLEIGVEHFHCVRIVRDEYISHIVGNDRDRLRKGVIDFDCAVVGKPDYSVVKRVGDVYRVSARKNAARRTIKTELTACRRDDFFAAAETESISDDCAM